jgi:hypothetical protein
MEIREIAGPNGTEYDVTLHERTLESLKKLQKFDRVDEKPFEAVAALSELTERAYELLLRPAVREMAPDWAAKLLRDFHPLRVQRWALSDRNPLMAMLAPLAALTRANRHPRSKDNLARHAEHFFSASTSAALDLYRDLRDAGREAAFYYVYGNMMSLQMADQRAVIRRQTRFDPRALPAVRQVLDEIDQGGLADAIIRVGILVVKAGGGKRRLAQMEETRALLAPTGVMRHIDEEQFRRLLHEETLVVEFEPVLATRSLPKLARSAGDRHKLNNVFDSLEADGTLDARQKNLLAELRKLVPRPGTPASDDDTRSVSRRRAPSKGRAARAVATQPAGRRGVTLRA